MNNLSAEQRAAALVVVGPTGERYRYLVWLAGPAGDVYPGDDFETRALAERHAEFLRAAIVPVIRAAEAAERAACLAIANAVGAMHVGRTIDAMDADEDSAPAQAAALAAAAIEDAIRARGVRT